MLKKPRRNDNVSLQKQLHWTKINLCFSVTVYKITITKKFYGKKIFLDKKVTRNSRKDFWIQKGANKHVSFTTIYVFLKGFFGFFFPSETFLRVIYIVKIVPSVNF